MRWPNARTGEIIEATLSACPHCAHALGPADQRDSHAYDHIDLSPLSPIVTHINRHRGVCPCCRKRAAALAPEGFEPGSPFGSGLGALIIHLHVTQAISFQLLHTMAIGRRRPDLKDSTLRHYHGDLERRLDRLLTCQPDKPASRRLFKAVRRDRDDLFRFVIRRDVPYTNNACERALRPSVIFRKVTGGFRAEWGAKVYAAPPTSPSPAPSTARSWATPPTTSRQRPTAWDNPKKPLPLGERVG